MNLKLVCNRLVFIWSIVEDIALDVSDSRQRVVQFNHEPHAGIA